MTKIRKEPVLDNSTLSTTGVMHTMKDDETIIDLTLHAYGHPYWKEVFDHFYNLALRSRRKHPMYMQPGDQIFLPPRPKFAVSGASGEMLKWIGLGIDLIQIAKNWHTNLQGLLDDFEDSSKAKRAAIASWAIAMAEHPEYGEYIQRERANAFLNMRAELRLRCEEAAWQLVTLRTSTRFQLELETRPTSENSLLYADLSQGLEQCDVGRSYIISELKSTTSNLYRDILVAAKASTKVHVSLLDTFSAYASQIPKAYGSATIPWVTKNVLTLGLGLRPSDFKVMQHTAASSRTVYEIRISPAAQKNLEARLKGAQNLARGLLVISFGFSADRALRESDLKSELMLARDSVLLLHEAYPLIVSRLRWLPAVGRTILKSMGAALESAYQLYQAGEADRFGDRDKAVIHYISGASAVGFAFTFGIAWPAGIVVAIVLAAGYFISRLFTDTPLERWCKNNEFGSNSVRTLSTFGGAKVKGPWIGRLDLQIRKLYEIVTIPDIQSWRSSPGYLNFMIQPHFLPPGPTVWITVEWLFANRHIFLGHNLLCQNHYVDERGTRVGVVIEDGLVERIYIFSPALSIFNRDSGVWMSEDMMRSGMLTLRMSITIVGLGVGTIIHTYKLGAWASDQFQRVSIEEYEVKSSP